MKNTVVYLHLVDLRLDQHLNKMLNIITENLNFLHVHYYAIDIIFRYSGYTKFALQNVYNFFTVLYFEWLEISIILTLLGPFCCIAHQMLRLTIFDLFSAL